MKKMTNGSDQHVAAQAEVVDLLPDVATALELAYLKIESAHHALTARKAELENLVLQVRALYEEKGKYSVLQIDMNTKKVHRAPAASRMNESAVSSEQDRS